MATAKKKAKKSTARKAAPKKKPAAKKTAKNARKTTSRPKAANLGPKPVKTGRGATPLELANDMMALLRAGNMAEIEERLLAPSLESVEGVGASMAWKGKKSVLRKYRDWEADHEIHEMQVEGPWVGATGFAVKYAIDVTQNSTGQRSGMEEIAVYTVRDGKITREEFHFKV